jgi:hypothetical protein
LIETLPHDAVVLLEIKSSKETTAPSSSYRQRRKYSQRTGGVPAVLVVAHELPAYVNAYFRMVGVDVVDLRRYLPSGG